MDLEERRAVEAALRRFTERVGGTLFAGEGPDGDLSLVPGLLAEGRGLDLVASPAPGAPGYELGVWGVHCWEEGLERSLLALSILGEACAGLATAVHAQGLACLAITRHKSEGENGLFFLREDAVLTAAYMPRYGLPLGTRFGPEGSGLRLEEVALGARLVGTGHFLLAAGQPAALVCFARTSDTANGEWVSLVIPVGAPGLALEEVGQRTGLRAVRQYHLHCEQVGVSPGRILHCGAAARCALKRVLACDWLGQAAIALGMARRSLRDARLYAAGRYQGGSLIQEHAAIQLLHGTAEYDVALLEAIVQRRAHQPLASFDPRALLQWGITARLAVIEHAHRAVTDCLQTLGGYGYMEDYRLEKRLRDVSTLKSLHGPPDQLKLYLNQLSNDA